MFSDGELPRTEHLAHSRPRAERTQRQLHSGLVALIEGNLLYDGSSGTAAYEAIASNLDTAAEARQENLDVSTREFDEQYAAERAEEKAVDVDPGATRTPTTPMLAVLRVILVPKG